VEYDGTSFYVTDGSGTRYTLAKTLTATASLNFPDTPANSSAEMPIALTGAADGDAVILGIPNSSNVANTTFTARVSSANTVSVKFNNYSGSSINPNPGTFRVSVLKY
jgi:hypothetical protein